MQACKSCWLTQGWRLLHAIVILLMIGGTAGQSFSPCYLEDGCAVLTPKFWTQIGVITFNFTGLEEATNSVSDYQWGLGTSPGVHNTIAYQSVTGSDVKFNSFAVNTLEGQDVQIGGTTFYNRTIFALNYTIPGQSLLDGQLYYVSVQASGPGITPVNASSDAVQVATTSPALEPQGYIYNTQSCGIDDSQRDTSSLWACWDPFEDTVTNVTSYSVQAFQQQPGDVADDAVGSPVYAGLNRTAHITGLRLNVGSKYYVRVIATNAAELMGDADAPALLILAESNNLSSVAVAFIVAGSIIAVGILAFVIVYYFVRRQYKAAVAERLREKDRTKVLKSLMYGLVTGKSDDAKSPAEQLRNARDLAFVITDVQSSTAQAASNPSAFLKIQEIHDTVMREGIAKHGGYEINTEGDAFHIAFASVPQAVLFCMESQYRLLDTAWPREVLKLPACGEVWDKDGALLMRGPRVRMGIHYAVEGTVAHRLHLLTKHRVFSGPGFQVAVEVGDCADGGQVLMTHDAWLRLEENMAAAGFPTVKQIGLFKLNAWPSPMWLYEVSSLLGRQLHRLHGEPRKIQLLETGWGLNIVPPPEPRDGALLTFVSLRLDFSKKPAELRPDRSMRLTLASVVGGSNAGAADVPTSLARRLFESVAISAMQFRGYIHFVRENQGLFGAVFHSTLDAVRFTHAAQVRLLYTKWPSEARDPYCGTTEMTPDGRLLFAGPRVATAVHETTDFEAQRVSLPSQGQREQDVHYTGIGVEFTQRLAEAAHGGQVVLSESAWASVQDQLPGSSQVISLGTHVVDERFEGAMLLMEVMPTILARRHFPPPATAETLEPGFRDSPDPAAGMALVFTRVARPPEVVAAEQARGQMSEEDIVRVLTAFNIGVAKFSRLVRQLLPHYDGYECKEPEPGKFTLAFQTLESAVRWSCTLQKELLAVAWPEAVLDWPECAEVSHIDAAGMQTLVWRGLRARIGTAYGCPQYRKPLNTGRADYYGSLPNLAARVSALAAPGQILVEGSAGFQEEVRWIAEDSMALMPLSREFSRIANNEEEDFIELLPLGFFMLKGLDDAKPIIQANPCSLSTREFEPLAAAMRVAVPPKRGKSASHGHGNGSFLSVGSGDSNNSSLISGHPLSSIARTGSKMFSSLLGEIAPLPRLRSKEASLPAPKSGPQHTLSSRMARRPSEEQDLQVSRPAPGNKCPWGSFAENLAMRVRGVTASPRPSTGPTSRQQQVIIDLQRRSSLQPQTQLDSEQGSQGLRGGEAGPAAPSGSPDSDLHLPVRSASTEGNSHPGSSGSEGRTGAFVGGSAPPGGSQARLPPWREFVNPLAAQQVERGRAQSLPAWRRPAGRASFQGTTSGQVPPLTRAALSSPPTMRENSTVSAASSRSNSLRLEKHSSADLRDLMTPGGIYAQEVAHMFAANRRLWGQSQAVQMSDSQRPPIFRTDSPMPSALGVGARGPNAGQDATSTSDAALHGDSSEDGQGQPGFRGFHRQAAYQHVPESTEVAEMSGRAESMPVECSEAPGPHSIADSVSNPLQRAPAMPIPCIADPSLVDMPRESAPRSAMELASTSPAFPNPLLAHLAKDSTGAATEASTSFSSYNSTPRGPVRPRNSPSAYVDDPAYFYPGRGGGESAMAESCYRRSASRRANAAVLGPGIGFSSESVDEVAPSNLGFGPDGFRRGPGGPLRLDQAQLEGAPRTASGSRLSRRAMRRAAVMELEQRRRLGHETAEIGGSPVERTWSFATEGTHQSEIPPVPEDHEDTFIEVATSDMSGTASENLLAFRRR